MHFLFWTKRSHPLPKNLYKSYTKCIRKLYKTLKLYLFCIQILYKLKFCMIMNIQKMCIKFLHIYKKCTNCTKLVHSSNQKRFEIWNVCFLFMQIMYKLYKTIKVANWNSLCMFFVHTHDVQTIQNIYKC